MLATALVALVAIMFFRAAPASGLDEAVDAAIEAELGSEVSIAPEYTQSADGWVLTCGTVLDASGGPLDFATLTYGETPLESADYCALVRTVDGAEIVEIDIGATDMPAMDWMETHDLPQALLSGG